MDFTDVIHEGMEMIIRGCKMNPSWRGCEKCPFSTLCNSICKDDEHHFSTPKTWEEEGIWI